VAYQLAPYFAEYIEYDEHRPGDEWACLRKWLRDDVEKELYLTPGGRYTASDIAANGNVTASQKFKSFRSKHDMNPKAGDRICPVTETKANPECTWIIDGKSYQFCCPPCVDEFVKLAKASSDALATPESYVKK
jgi:YHS domain-containing protein